MGNKRYRRGHRSRSRKRGETTIGLSTEASLVSLLVRQGCTVLQSPELDNVFKIDALIQHIRNAPSTMPPIGLQITRSRDNMDKQRVFLQESAKWPGIGPRVYVEIRKRLTNDSAIVIRDFLLKLWTDPSRGGMDSGWKLVVWPRGRRITMRIA